MIPKTHGINKCMKNELKVETNFGKRLAQIRKTKGMTQQQLADMIGVSRRVIAYYEGETSFPPAHLIIPLSEALNVTTDELLGIKEPKGTLDPKLAALWRRLKVMETFSEKDKKTVLHHVEAIAEKNKAQSKTSTAKR